MSQGIRSSQQNLGIDVYLWVLLQRARSVATRARNLELSQYGVNIEQMSILHSLLVNGGFATIDEISINIVRRKNSVTTLVDRMFKMGLVTKERLTTDKKYRISLTPKARELINKVPRKSIGMLFSDFDPQEKEQIVKYLEQMITTGLDMLGENYIPPFLSKKDPADVD